jgi:hypothetical protein
MVRVSPGSPSQWKATLSPRPASTWRSTAVVRHVQLAADEPLREGQLPLEGGVEVGVPAEQLAGLAGPEGLVVGGGLVVEGPVGDEGLGDELRRRREAPLLDVELFDCSRRSATSSASAEAD